MFCVFFVYAEGVQAKNRWHSVKLGAMVHTDQYVLGDTQQLSLQGIRGVDLDFPTWSERCLTENIKLTLDQLLQHARTQVRYEPSDDSIVYGHLKIDGQNLAEWLLRQGWAVMTDEDHSYRDIYREAEKYAQQNHLGRWGQCDPHLPMIKWQKTHGKTPWFWDRYHHLIRGSAIGQVAEVISGDTLKLRNGLQLRLSDIEMPADNSTAEQCFRTQAQGYLRHLTLGRKVLFVSGQANLHDFKTLNRTIYRPKTRWRPRIDLSEAMVRAGYAQGVGRLEDLQKEIWQSPVGAWAQCARLVFEDEEDVEVVEAVVPEPELIYDEVCPIKGNIAGSKKNPKKTYHTPLSGWYKRIVYEECFDSEEAAEAAGFKKVK